MRRSRSWLWFIPVIAVWATILLTYGGFQEDDAFITFRYARNLAEGYGFVYNVGEPHHFGTSTPLFKLVLGLLGVPWPQAIPQIGFALSALGLLACAFAMLAFWWGSRREIGLIAALLVLVNPLNYYSLGMEMPVQAALILWGFVFCKQNKGVLGISLLTTAVLLRPDAVVALVFGFAYLAWRFQKIPFREAAVSCLILMPFAIAAKLYFGTVIPATAAAKEAQVESGLWLSYVPGTLRFIQQKYLIGMHMPIGPPFRDKLMPLPMWWAVPPLVVLGLCYGRRIALPVLWAAGMVVAYQVGQVTFNDWYVFPVGIAVSGLLASAASLLSRRNVLVYGWGLTVFLLWYACARAANYVDSRRIDYVLAARWLKENTRETDTVGFCEIGYVGWYGERTMIDPLGLIHAGLDTHVAARDIGYGYRKLRPDYIVDCLMFTPFFTTNGSYGWIHKNYSPVITFHEPGYPAVIIVKRNDVAAPAGAG